MGSKDLTEFLEILRKECETAINWFETNKMIVNPNKFQSMIISSKKDLSKSLLNINGVELTMELLSIEIDNKLNFEKHISANTYGPQRKRNNKYFRAFKF